MGLVSVVLYHLPLNSNAIQIYTFYLWEYLSGVYQLYIDFVYIKEVCLEYLLDLLVQILLYFIIDYVSILQNKHISIVLWGYADIVACEIVNAIGRDELLLVDLIEQNRLLIFLFLNEFVDADPLSGLSLQYIWVLLFLVEDGEGVDQDTEHGRRYIEIELVF